MGIRDDAIPWMAMMALNITDLRAAFEAQLRTLAHAEDQLRRCRTARDDTTLRASLDTFCRDVATMSTNNLAIRDVLDAVAGETPDAIEERTASRSS